MMKVALGLGEDEKGLDDESLIVSLYHQMKVSPTCRVVSWCSRADKSESRKKSRKFKIWFSRGKKGSARRVRRYQLRWVCNKREKIVTEVN